MWEVSLHCAPCWPVGAKLNPLEFGDDAGANLEGRQSLVPTAARGSCKKAHERSAGKSWGGKGDERVTGVSSVLETEGQHFTQADLEREERDQLSDEQAKRSNIQICRGTPYFYFLLALCTKGLEVKH